jgi:hypothetical protein
LLKPELHHFARAAREISKHGDNDTLPFDMDVRFCGDEAEALATIAYGFYKELRDSEAAKDNCYVFLSERAEALAHPAHGEDLRRSRS